MCSSVRMDVRHSLGPHVLIIIYLHQELMVISKLMVIIMV